MSSKKNKKSKVPRTMNAAGTIFFLNFSPSLSDSRMTLKNTIRCAGGETETIGRVTKGSSDAGRFGQDRDD